MTDRKLPMVEDVPTETAEMAFRRIARRKLIARGYPEDQIEAKTTALMQKGAKLRIDVGKVLGGRPDEATAGDPENPMIPDNAVLRPYAPLFRERIAVFKTERSARLARQQGAADVSKAAAPTKQRSD